MSFCVVSKALVEHSNGQIKEQGWSFYVLSKS